MITVTLTRNGSDRRIVKFEVSGHANYAKRGQDIVCAGVSAVTVGTVNSIEAVAGVNLPYSIRDGWVSSDIPTQADSSVDERVQLLLESMAVMIGSIQETYGKYVTIQEQFVQ
ncbi:ribosomal-processing cysteine protease Prp [Paenibacillus kobensis]|uniref:ribosomal-processing cysteine protease Prp n=1 Tax=Paenibacillus kobensis TaxID=59841 RepID=UPI000FDA81C1|nr:ribosomal-processing cysteine protease Prp [Paenibacillus kobensis]